MYLRADGLHCHAQPLSRSHHAAFFAHHPKVIQMVVIEIKTHIQFFTKKISLIICF
jgi:hypothetical protein